MSTTVFVIRNQQGQYLSKQQEWVDGADNHVLYRTRHRDEAINSIFEVSSRDIYLRAETIVCELDGKNNPALATAEVLTSARAAQLARQQNADLEDEPAATEEAASEETPTDTEGGAAELAAIDADSQPPTPVDAAADEDHPSNPTNSAQL